MRVGLFSMKVAGILGLLLVTPLIWAEEPIHPTSLDLGVATSYYLPDTAIPQSWAWHVGGLTEMQYAFSTSVSIGASCEASIAYGPGFISPIIWTATTKFFWRVSYDPFGVRLATGIVLGQNVAGLLVGGQFDFGPGYLAIDEVSGTTTYTNLELGLRFQAYSIF